jgi:hypothetical protein
MKKLRAFCCLLLMMFVATSHTAKAQTTKADPFEDALREAVKQYRAGKPAEARVALDKAKALLDKAKSEEMGSALPDPPTGWVAEEMKTEDVSALYGGGKVLKKLYKNKTGQEEMQVEVFYGSSFIKLIRGLFASEEVAKSQGFEIKRAGGEKALVKKIGDKNFEINMPLEEDVMVKLTGKDGTAEDLMLKFLRDIDRRALLHAK